MIVTEEDVSTALAYLAADPHPLAAAKFTLTKAENQTRLAYNQRFVQEAGSNDVRKARAELDDYYLACQADEEGAILDHEQQKSRLKWAETVVEIWRTENANARAAERVR